MSQAIVIHTIYSENVHPGLLKAETCIAGHFFLSQVSRGLCPGSGGWQTLEANAVSSPSMPAVLFTDIRGVFSVMPSKQKPSVTMTSPTAPSKSPRHHMGMSTFLSDTVWGGEQKQRHRVAQRCPSLQERCVLPNLSA